MLNGTGSVFVIEGAVCGVALANLRCLLCYELPRNCTLRCPCPMAGLFRRYSRLHFSTSLSSFATLLITGVEELID
jgi:hypothetical protein